jgi:acetyl-CoA acyltransferase
MAAEDIWVLGIHMTKFGKHPDRDVVDLAKDIGVIGAGGLMDVAGHGYAAGRN